MFLVVSKLVYVNLATIIHFFGVPVHVFQLINGNFSIITLKWSKLFLNVLGNIFSGSAYMLFRCVFARNCINMRK